MTKPNTKTRSKMEHRLRVMGAGKLRSKRASSKKEAPHPLETVFGMFKDDPMLDAMLENIRQLRREMAEKDAGED